MNPDQRPFWMPDAQGFVAGSVIVMAAVALFYRMGHPSTVDDKVLDMMLTILYGTAFVAIVNFLFGSSRSSQTKDATLATLATAPAPTIAPASLSPVAATTTAVVASAPTPSAPAAPVASRSE